MDEWKRRVTAAIEASGGRRMWLVVNPARERCGLEVTQGRATEADRVKDLTGLDGKTVGVYDPRVGLWVTPAMKDDAFVLVPR